MPTTTKKTTAAPAKTAAKPPTKKTPAKKAPARKPPRTPVIVDLSHHQEGAIAWAAAKRAGLAGIVHKATEATTFIDPKYTTRRSAAAAHAIDFGAYHFAGPKLGNAKTEAAYFLEHSQLKAADLCAGLDIEWSNTGGLTPAQLDRWAIHWGQAVKAKLGGVPLWLYSPFHLPKAEAFFDFVWRPRYNDADEPPTLTWDLWQYCNGVLGKPNRLAGIPFPCDLSHLRPGLTLAELKARRPVKAPRKPKPKPKPAPAYTPSKGMIAAIDRAAEMAKHHTVIGIGECGKSVRIAVTNDPNSRSLGTTAALKMAHVELHRETDWAKIPNGSIVWGGPGSSGAGHVAFKDLGSGPGKFDGHLLTPGSPEVPAEWADEPNWAALQRGWTKDSLIGWSPDIDGHRP